MSQLDDGHSQPPSIARSRLSVRAVGDIESLVALAPTWNVLLESSRSNTIFLTWEWVYTWWQIYGEGRRLHVLVVEGEAVGIVGIAPLMKVRSRVLGLLPVEEARFIGDGGDVTPEYLDLFAAPGFEHAVVSACVEHLCADATVSAVDLRPLSNASANAGLLEQLFLCQRGRTSRAADSVCPVLPLPATAAEFMASRSKNYRKKFREYAKRCDRELGVTVRRTSAATELDRDMGALVALHTKRWRGSSRAFRSSRYCEFHQCLARLMLAAGRLRLFSLEKDGTALALLYCFVHDQRYSFYQGGRDPDYAGYRVGLVLMHNVILQAIHEGATVFDFLGGVEDYKYRWATAEARSERVRYAKVGWASAIYVLSDFVFRMRRKAARLKVSVMRNRHSSSPARTVLEESQAPEWT